MKLIFAIILGKLISYLTKILNLGGGSAAPGLFALKLEPKLIELLSKQIPQNVVITGTNGKTTTARFLSHFAKANNVKIIRNHTGSNLARGVASTLIQCVKLTHTGCVLNRHIGIWELDEAAFNQLVFRLKPKIIILLNVFRDQLDRYGEVDSVIKKWKETLSRVSQNTLVLINNDDHNLKAAVSDFPGEIQSFGVKDLKILGESLEKSPSKEKPNFEAKNVKTEGLEKTTFDISFDSQLKKIALPIPGIYHIYDFLAAFACGYNLRLPTDSMLNALKNYSSAFGRFEKIEIPIRDCSLNSNPGLQVQTRTGYFFLIKNPAGATQVFETIAPQLKNNDHLLIALNDNFADGTDVSWIWDAQFERLTVNDLRLTTFCSGKRAQDLAVRLKYAGFNSDNLVVENDLREALNIAQKDLKGRLFILPTYTALLDLQKLFAKNKIKEHYWKENI